MSDRRDVFEALGRTLIGLGGKRPPAKLTDAPGGGGSETAVGFDNPMSAAGDLIVGGESGAAKKLPVGTDAQVLTLVAGVPAWADAAAGTGTGTGRYRMYLLATDGLGGFSFIDDGTGHPVTSLESLE